MKRFYVYILLCSDRSFYAGITNDPEYRLGQHQTGEDPKCYTFKRRPVTMVHCADFPTALEAIAWEKHLKGWSRAKKAAYISNNFSLVHELAKCTNATGRKRA